MSISHGVWRLNGKDSKACSEKISSNLLAEDWIARYEVCFDTDIQAQTYGLVISVSSYHESTDHKSLWS